MRKKRMFKQMRTCTRGISILLIATLLLSNITEPHTIIGRICREISPGYWTRQGRWWYPIRMMREEDRLAAQAAWQRA